MQLRTDGSRPDQLTGRLVLVLSDDLLAKAAAEDARVREIAQGKDFAGEADPYRAPRDDEDEDEDLDLPEDEEEEVEDEVERLAHDAPDVPDSVGDQA